MDEMKQHYIEYKKKMGDLAYRMKRHAGTSRVAFLTQLIEQQVPAGGKILDIGCGDLHLATVLPHYAWSGIDLATDLSDGRAQAWDLMQTPYPFEDATFDAVICSEVLEHVWNPLLIHDQAKRLLKPDGLYLISTPNFDNIDYLLNHHRPLLFDPIYPHLCEHIRQYNLENHTDMLGKIGFTPFFHVGADAHFVKFFEKARVRLWQILREQFKLPANETTVDQILGQMFPENDHTILIASRHSKP